MAEPAAAQATVQYAVPLSRAVAQSRLGPGVPTATAALHAMSWFLVGAAAGGLLITRLFPKTQWPAALGVGTIGLYLGAGSPPLSVPEMLGMGLLGVSTGWFAFKAFEPAFGGQAPGQAATVVR